MSMVLFYDRKTGGILKADPHPEWGPREVVLNYYRKNPGIWPDGAGILTVPEDVSWDDRPENWIAVLDVQGNPKLVRRDDYEIEQEIERAKEKVLLMLARDHASPRARAEIEARLARLGGY